MNAILGVFRLETTAFILQAVVHINIAESKFGGQALHHPVGTGNIIICAHRHEGVALRQGNAAVHGIISHHINHGVRQLFPDDLADISIIGRKMHESVFFLRHRPKIIGADVDEQLGRLRVKHYGIDRR